MLLSHRYPDNRNAGCYVAETIITGQIVSSDESLLVRTRSGRKRRANTSISSYSSASASTTTTSAVAAAPPAAAAPEAKPRKRLYDGRNNRLDETMEESDDTKVQQQVRAVVLESFVMHNSVVAVYSGRHQPHAYYTQTAHPPATQQMKQAQALCLYFCAPSLSFYVAKRLSSFRTILLSYITTPT